MIIGIGVESDPRKVEASCQKVGTRFDIRCYGRPGTIVPETGIDPVFSSQPEKVLVADLIEGTIDAAVRGTLSANATLQELKRQFRVPTLERIALLETAGKKQFLLTPVGVDEGWTVAEKHTLIRKGQAIARAFRLEGGTGILSGGRLGDLGRHPSVDRSLGDAELLARLSGARHYEILIEDAIQDCSLLIAPDGISGNLIFRTLVFLGGGKGYGAPVVNIDRIFVDTSRASPDYANALFLAAALSDLFRDGFKRLGE